MARRLEVVIEMLMQNGAGDAPLPSLTIERNSLSWNPPLSVQHLPFQPGGSRLLKFSLSPSGYSGSDLRLLGSLSYSEASDSWERYFSDISVILITGPLRFFFFREGVLERPDLEAATETQRVGEGRGWRPYP